MTGEDDIKALTYDHYPSESEGEEKQGEEGEETEEQKEEEYTKIEKEETTKTQEPNPQPSLVSYYNLLRGGENHSTEICSPTFH